MAKLNKRQEVMTQSYMGFKGAARGMVVMFEGQLQGYWGEDNRDSQWLSFFVNLIKDTPRLQKDVISLIPRYTGCKVVRNDGVFVVENNKDLTKKQKEAYRKKIGDLVSAEWPTIQDIDKPVKEEKEKEAPDNEKRFKVAGKAMLKDGVSINQLLSMMEEMAIENAAEEAKEQAEEAKDVAIEAVKLEAHLEEVA